MSTVSWNVKANICHLVFANSPHAMEEIARKRKYWCLRYKQFIRVHIESIKGELTLLKKWYAHSVFGILVNGHIHAHAPLDLALTRTELTAVTTPTNLLMHSFHFSLTVLSPYLFAPIFYSFFCSHLLTQAGRLSPAKRC